jgi:putative flavoprotein involved in K+ transport
MDSHSPAQQISSWLSQFSQALENTDIDSALSMFDDECYWRDIVSFTWNIKTMESKEEIKAMLESQLSKVKPHSWEIEGTATSANGIIEAQFTFQSAVSDGKGYIRLKDNKCWTLLTTMSSLKGFEEKSGHNRSLGAKQIAVKNRKSWLEQKSQEKSELGYSKQPYCVIIGGGQGGIALATRLKRLDVPTIIIEKNESAGDSWRNRYNSLTLHDPVWYDQMPYIPFPDDWPIYLPKDQVADFLEMYAKIMDLNYWNSTVCKHAFYDEDKQNWTVTVEREGKTIVLNPNHLIFATGMAGVPRIPDLEGADTFQGEQLHTSQYKSGKKYADKRCIVVGSGTSAHDICADLWEQGAEPTMIQRSSTLVMNAKTHREMMTSLYSEESLDKGITLENADLISASMPYRLAAIRSIPTWEAIARDEADFYDRLDRAGFLLDFGDDGTGLGAKYIRRGSGYYIDVGASGMIVDGKIKLYSGVSVNQLTEKSVILTDGSELPADVIIYATGYTSMNDWVAKLISQDVADRVGKCWGIGSNTTYDPGPWEGELRNMWKPTQHPALWFHGGNLAQSRFYSIFVSLQIKARMEGIETPVYDLSPSYHLR